MRKTEWLNLTQNHMLITSVLARCSGTAACGLKFKISCLGRADEKSQVYVIRAGRPSRHILKKRRRFRQSSETWVPMLYTLANCSGLSIFLPQHRIKRCAGRAICRFGLDISYLPFCINPAFFSFVFLDCFLYNWLFTTCIGINECKEAVLDFYGEYSCCLYKYFLFNNCFLYFNRS